MIIIFVDFAAIERKVILDLLEQDLQREEAKRLRLSKELFASSMRAEQLERMISNAKNF